MISFTVRLTLKPFEEKGFSRKFTPVDRIPRRAMVSSKYPDM
jgi:hypothetical protein